MPIFSTVDHFEEQVGRRKVHKKPNELDTLDCVFIGPSNQAGLICPDDLAVHPEFSSMVCIGWEVISRECDLAEVRVSYTGKVVGGGFYYTYPELTTEWHETTIGWTRNTNTYPQYVNTFNPGSVVVVSDNYLMKYTAKSATYRTMTNQPPQPGLNTLFSSQAQPWLGVLNEQFFKNGFRQKKTDFAKALGLTYQNDQTNHMIRYLGTGWWEMSETYMTRAYIAYGN